MRKYYLFVIKNDYQQIYKNHSYVLFKTLENLKGTIPVNFPYGISLYEQLCQTFHSDILNNYIKRKFKCKKINKKIIKINSMIENTYIQVNKSCAIILTNLNIPPVFRVFNIYNKRIFVCDFENQDYFWLNEQIKKSR